MPPSNSRDPEPVVTASALGRPFVWGPAILILFTSLFLVGCPGFGSEEVTGDFSDIPEDPTFADVKPTLDALCNDCHSAVPQEGAPGGFRYDVCADTDGDLGASSRADRIDIRTLQKIPTPMPPATHSPQPTAEDEELLRRWIEDGAPCE